MSITIDIMYSQNKKEVLNMVKFLMILFVLFIIHKLRKAKGKTIGQKIDFMNHNLRMRLKKRIETAELKYSAAADET